MVPVFIPLVPVFGTIQRMVVALFGEEMFIACNDDFEFSLFQLGKQICVCYCFSFWLI